MSPCTSTLILLGAAVCSLVPSGCTTVHQDCNPWGTPLEAGRLPVKSTIREFRTPEGASISVVWTGAKSVFDSRREVQRASAFLVTCSKAEWVTGRYIDGLPPEWVLRSPAAETDDVTVKLFPVTKIDVAIDPLVVVVFDTPCLDVADDEGSIRFPNAPDRTAAIASLGRGYLYGTFVPTSGRLMWFSPDMKIEPAWIKLTDDSRAQIVLPQANLALSRTSNGWQVLSEVPIEGNPAGVGGDTRAPNPN